MSIGQIPAEPIEAGGDALRFEIHKLITSVWKKAKLPQEWKESIVVHIYKRVIKLTVVIVEECHFSQVHNKILFNILL